MAQVLEMVYYFLIPCIIYSNFALRSLIFMAKLNGLLSRRVFFKNVLPF